MLVEYCTWIEVVSYFRLLFQLPPDRLSLSLALCESVKGYGGVWGVSAQVLERVVCTHSWLWPLFRQRHNPRSSLPRAEKNNGPAVSSLFFQLAYAEKVTQHSPKQTNRKKLHLPVSSVALFQLHLFFLSLKLPMGKLKFIQNIFSWNKSQLCFSSKCFKDTGKQSKTLQILNYSYSIIDHWINKQQGHSVKCFYLFSNALKGFTARNTLVFM